MWFSIFHPFFSSLYIHGFYLKMFFSNLLFYQDLPHSNKKKLDNFGTSRFHLKPAVHVERDLDLSQVNIVMINNNLFFQEASVR